MARTLTHDEWERNIGDIGPLTAAQMAADEGQTPEQWAEGYVDAWPFGDESEPADDLAERIAATIRAAMDTEADRLTDLLNELMDDVDDETTAHVVAEPDELAGALHFRLYDSYATDYADPVEGENAVREWARVQNEANAQRIEDAAEDERLRQMEAVE